MMILPEYQTSDSASSSKFHYLALLALLVVLVSFSSNFHHWPLLALLVALVSYSSNFHHCLLALLVALVMHWGDSADLNFAIL